MRHGNGLLTQEGLAREVVVADRDGGGEKRCVECRAEVRRGFPANFPHVCRECARLCVWQDAQSAITGVVTAAGGGTKE